MHLAQWLQCTWASSPMVRVEPRTFRDHKVLSLNSCSPCRVSRKLRTVYKTMSCMKQLRACFVMMPVPSIKLCAIASYRLFHSHAQIIISYWLTEVNRSITVWPLCYLMTRHYTCGSWYTKPSFLSCTQTLPLSKPPVLFPPPPTHTHTNIITPTYTRLSRLAQRAHFQNFWSYYCKLE